MDKSYNIEDDNSEKNGYWKKLTSHEVRLKEEKKEMAMNQKRFSKSLKIGIWSFVGTFFLELIGALLVGVRQSGMIPRKQIKFADIPEYYGEFIALSFFIAIVAFLITLFIPSLFFGTKSTTIMCDKCFKMKNFDSNITCKCGGKYYPIQEFKWVEYDKNKG